MTWRFQGRQASSASPVSSNQRGRGHGRLPTSASPAGSNQRGRGHGRLPVHHCRLCLRACRPHRCWQPRRRPHFGCACGHATALCCPRCATTWPPRLMPRPAADPVKHPDGLTPRTKLHQTTGRHQHKALINTLVGTFCHICSPAG